MDEKESFVPKSTDRYLPASQVNFIEKPSDFVPDPNFPKDHAFYGQRRCLAWSRRQGRQCMTLAMKGSTKCRAHGGANLGGIALPQFKDGTHAKSKYLPTDLLPKFQEMMTDPDLLSLKNEIMFLDVRAAQLFEALEGFADSTAWIRLLQDKYQKFMGAVARQETAEQARLIRELGKIIDAGAKQREVWNELYTLFEARKRLTVAERERIESMNAMWTAEQAMTFVTALSTSFKNTLEKHIPDDDKLRQDILQDQALAIRSLIDRNAEAT